MRKIISTILTIAIFFTLAIPSLAAAPTNLTWDGKSTTLSEIAKNIGSDIADTNGNYKPLYYFYASELWKNGLFLGSDGSFDLNNPLTRAEGVVMTIRILGKEAEAKAKNSSITFTDVPDWAKPYVAYASQNGITNGYSATTFGSSDPMTSAQFITLALRAMGYKDGEDFTWDKSYDKALEIELIDRASHAQYSRSNLFMRDNAAVIAYNAIFTAKTKAGGLLADSIAMPGNPSGTVPTAVREQSPPIDNEPNETIPDSYGNNVDAMCNAATRVVSGNKIYWIDNDSDALYSADYPSFGNRKTLCRIPYNSHSINLRGSTLYFYSMGFTSEESGIYKIDTNGGEQQLVKGGFYSAKFMALVGDKLFYIVGKEIRSCALDGSRDTLLVTVETYYDARITSEKLLVVDSGVLYSYNHDGSGKTQLASSINRIAVSGNTVYLQEYTRDISSINIDGSGKKTICNALSTGGFMAYSDNYIYMSVGNIILRYNVSSGEQSYIPCSAPDGLFVNSGCTHTKNASVSLSEYTNKKGVSAIQSTSVYKITGSSTSYEGKLSVSVSTPGLVVYNTTETMSNGRSRVITSVVYHATTGTAEVSFILTGNNPITAVTA